jgi:hypothetical protein
LDFKVPKPSRNVWLATLRAPANHARLHIRRHGNQYEVAVRTKAAKDKAKKAYPYKHTWREDCEATELLVRTRMAGPQGLDRESPASESSAIPVYGEKDIGILDVAVFL